MLSATAATGTPEELAEECCFELASRRERPTEFMQVLLDMTRVIFEPNPHGTFHLNSNWDFIAEAFPGATFRLGYVSVLGVPGQSVAAVAAGPLQRRIEELQYDLACALAAFFAGCVGRDLYRLKTTSELLRTFEAGFSVDDVFGAIKDVAAGEEGGAPLVRRSAGLALDEGLAPDQVRLSCWLFLPVPTNH